MATRRTKKDQLPATAAAPEPAPPLPVTYKGFNSDLTCRGFQFEIGKTYTVEGKVEACASGFHACEHPLDCFNYYPPATSRYFEVRQTGEIDRQGNDTKVASASITIGVELSLGDMAERAIRWVFGRSKPEGEAASGDQGAASATGNRGAASATGDQGAASATGDWGAASATGNRGAASATGNRGAASATGYQGAASATGDWGAASATGNRGAASATGNRGAASATGYQGAASATGYWGAASATGRSGIAHADGLGCRAMGGPGCAITLVNRDPMTGAIRHVFASIVGANGIKPDVYYTLSDDGLPVEAA